jgi:hypothetical protein
MKERFEPGDRVRLKDRPFGAGTITRVISGGYGQQLMAEVRWDTGMFGGPFVRDLERVAVDAGPTP